MSGESGISNGANSRRNKRTGTQKMESEGEPPLHNLTKHCMRQAINALAPGILNQTSLVAKVTTFCGELAGAASPRLKRRLGADTPLVQSLDIGRFVEGVTTPPDFCNLLEQAMLREESKINNAAVQSICYKYFSGEKKDEITFPKWFSAVCTYRLWMLFCVLVEDDYLTITKETFTEFLKQLVELSGFNWRDEPDIFVTNERFEFPAFLEAIMLCFEKYKLDRSLTCELIEDIHDEFVCGVLKKGYLIKKGHVRKNYKKRWFVLQRTNMLYYDSRKNMEKKGELVLNANTEVKSIPDEKEKKYRFLVSCGETGKVFELLAEDQRSKQQWMSAVSKAIALAKVIEQDVESSVKEFYLKKYGMEEPKLHREDSELKRARFLTNKGTRSSTFTESSTSGIPRKLSMGSECSTDICVCVHVCICECSTGNIELDERDEEDGDEEEGEYLSMEPLRSNSMVDDEDLELYVAMGEAPSAAVTTMSPRESALLSPTTLVPLTPTATTANKDPSVSNEGLPLDLEVDDRGYTYLDTRIIAELLNNSGVGGAESPGSDLGGDLYEEPRLVSPPVGAGRPPGGQGGLPDNESGQGGTDDVYEESIFEFRSPIHAAKSVEQRVQSGDPHTPDCSDNIYMDAHLMLAVLNDGEGAGQGVELSPADESDNSYGGWNLLAGSKTSSVLSALTSPQGATSPPMKALVNHRYIKMLAATEDRDSSSPEDVEQWSMPSDGLKPKQVNRAKSPLKICNEPIASSPGGDSNYNYVSWELLNQPSADDAAKMAMAIGTHTADATPTSEPPNSYLKVTRMSGLQSCSSPEPHPPPSLEPHPPPSLEPHLSIGTPMLLNLPQTEASFFPGGGPPNSAGLPSTPDDSSAFTSDNAHLYVNVDNIPVETEVPPIPSRGKRISKDISSDIIPAPPPRTATTNGAAKKKPVPNPRYTMIGQPPENVQ